MELEVDGWIEQLSQCRQLTEENVKRLCDKVRSFRGSVAGTISFPHLMTVLFLPLPDEGDSYGGVQRAASQVPSDGLRRHTWSICAHIVPRVPAVQ